MQKNNVLIPAFSLLLATAFYACQSSSANEESKEDTKTDSVEKVNRGEYLVTIMGCDDCHSPKRMGANGPEVIPELRLSGYPAESPKMKPDSNVVKEGWILTSPDLTSTVGPWGISYSANLTPDETGTGNWTEAQFSKAMREGKWKGLDGSRTLLPPMPWPSYASLKDEDLSSIFNYLRTIKPVHNIVPAPKQIKDVE